MTANTCHRCQRAAEFSVSLLISTVGKSPRQQKCGESVHFCGDCIRLWMVHIGSVEPRTVERSARRAYTAIVANCRNRSSC